MVSDAEEVVVIVVVVVVVGRSWRTFLEVVGVPTSMIYKEVVDHR